MSSEVNYGLINQNTLDYGAQDTRRITNQKLEFEYQQLRELQKRLAESGQNPDITATLDAMINSGSPEHVKIGLEGKQKIKELEAFHNAYYGTEGDDQSPEARINRLMPLGNETAFKAVNALQKQQEFKEPTEVREYNYAKKDPQFLDYKLTTKRAGATNINMPPQEEAFEKELGKQSAAKIIEKKEKAEDAAKIIHYNEIGRNLINSGMVTGAGAEYVVNFGRALKRIGADFGGDDVTNSQIFAAVMANNVGKVVKQFGSGAGVSDADRAFAEKMAGGNITLNKDALLRIIDINTRMAKLNINEYNKDVKGIKSKIPLEVKIPTENSPFRTGGTVNDGPNVGKIIKGTGDVNSGPNKGKTIILFTDGSKEYR
jgi:hypothetical protein